MTDPSQRNPEALENAADEASTERDNPGVVVRPPVLYLGALAAGLVLDFVFHFGFGAASGPARIAGGVLAGIGAGLLGWCMTLFARAGTNVPTSKPVHALVVTGPYRVSRNPIYVGLTLVYAGVALGSDAPLALGFLAVVLPVMQRGVIAREEAYLDAKFSVAYATYRARTRRWL